MPKPSIRAERKRAAIRKAAYACFREHGYHLSTVDAICEAAEISKGSFYWHYSSKHEVFVDVLEVWTREIMAEVYEQFERASTDSDYVSSITKALLREAHRGRAIVPLWLEFTVHAQREPEIRAALAKMYARARSAIVEMVRPLAPGLSEGKLRGIANVIFGAYTGVLLQEIADPKGADVSESVPEFMSVLGLLLQSAPERPSDGLPTTGEWQSLMAPFDDPTRMLLAEIRNLVFSVSNDPGEKVVVGWKNVSYGRPRRLFYLKPLPTGVRVGVYDKAFLSGHQELFEPRGKKAVALEVTSDRFVELKDSLLGIFQELL